MKVQKKPAKIHWIIKRMSMDWRKPLIILKSTGTHVFYVGKNITVQERKTRGWDILSFYMKTVQFMQTNGPSAEGKL
jgi:hypothetical protein